MAVTELSLSNRQLGDPAWLFFNVTFHGELIESVQDLTFTAVQFGGNNQQCIAMSSCKGEGQESSSSSSSALEFFLWRSVFYNTYPDLAWQFKDTSNERILLDGLIPWNGPMLQYVHECDASDACIEFSMSVPETTTILKGKSDTRRNITYFESDPYRIRLDGVLFADRRYQFEGSDDDDDRLEYDADGNTF